MYILDVKLFSEAESADMFSHSSGCLFTLSIVSCDTQKRLKVQFIFFFCCLCFWFHIQEITAKSNVTKLVPNVFFYEFCSFRSWIHFELTSYLV